MAKLKRTRILGIETSCDETSVALLELNNEHVKIKKHFIATQIPIHARYGGVVPEIAARTHVAEVISLIEKTTAWKKEVFDAIAVTRGPGLATALRIGLEAGKTLAWSYKKPLLPINHLEGHLASAWLVPQNRKDWKFPILFLLVSGGHTELVLMRDFGKYKILGRTRDDASGEAFDKTAKLLGLEYPGGPKLSKLAEQGNPEAYELPRPMINDPSLDFSFSGLKTAVRQLVEGRQGRIGRIEDLCASIQAAIVEVLVAKTVRAAIKVKPKAVAVVGGVSANPLLKAELRKALRRKCPGIKLLAPAQGLFTDNGAMIAAAGLWHLMKNKKTQSWRQLDADPGLDL